MLVIPIPLEDVPNKKKLIIGTRTWLGSDWDHCDIDPTPLRTHPGLDFSAQHPVDIVCDATNLSTIPSGTYGYVYSSECLEHFSWRKYQSVLQEWCRVVAPSGYIRIEVPDFLAAARQVLEADSLDMDRAIQQVIFAEQLNPYDYHYVGLTPRMLTEDFNRLEFTVTDIQRGWECGWLRVDARK